VPPELAGGPGRALQRLFDFTLHSGSVGILT
jgi:hypothetical protein